MYGFEKNERPNIADDELRFLREVAKELLALKDMEIVIAVSKGELVEIYHD